MYTCYVRTMMTISGRGATPDTACEAAIRDYEARIGYGDGRGCLPDRTALRYMLMVVPDADLHRHLAFVVQRYLDTQGMEALLRRPGVLDVLMTSFYQSAIMSWEDQQAEEAREDGQAEDGRDEP